MLARAALPGFTSSCAALLLSCNVNAAVVYASRVYSLVNIGITGALTAPNTVVRSANGAHYPQQEISVKTKLNRDDKG